MNKEHGITNEEVRALTQNSLFRVQHLIFVFDF
jgi:hypothetical protein